MSRILTWEDLKDQVFDIRDKRKKEKPNPEEPDVPPPAPEAEKQDACSGAAGPEPIEFPDAEEPRKIPLDNEPDDEDFPSKENGFFLKVPKLKSDGTPVIGADGPMMRDVPDYDGFSRYVGRKYYLKTNDAFSYLYEEAHYRQVTPMQLENLALNLIQKNSSPNLIAGFAKHARAHNFIRQDDLVEPKGLINLKNGILNVKNRGLLDHSPEYFFKYCLPHEYKMDAKCPHWLDFLKRTFEGNEDLANVCAEVFGYILLGGEPFLHKAFVLSGEGRNGKSTFLDVLKFLIGRANYTSIPVGNLDKAFSVVSADGKLANLVGETPTQQINSEAFKTAVGGEELTAAQKGLPEYMLPFHARIVMACNRAPHLGDATTGAHEKLFIIPFNRYLQKSERTVLYAKRHLFPEMSGIINWALDGLERLVVRGGLPEIEAVNQQSIEMRAETDTVFAWFRENAVFDQESKERIQFKDYYPSYRDWCHHQGHNHPVTANTFCKRIGAEIKKVPHCLTTYPGRVLTVVAGVRLVRKPALGAGLEF